MSKIYDTSFGKDYALQFLQNRMALTKRPSFLQNNRKTWKDLIDEQNEEWLIGRRYLKRDDIHEGQNRICEAHPKMRERRFG
jgi:hypothetical protein